MTTKKARPQSEASDDLRTEYAFDYEESRENRFAPHMGDRVVTVVLEPDVAEVFDTSESVNRLLRSVISAMPDLRSPGDSANPRDKTG